MIVGPSHMTGTWGNPGPISSILFLSGFEEGLTVATVVESALCALRNCLAFMPPGKSGNAVGVLWLRGQFLTLSLPCQLNRTLLPWHSQSHWCGSASGLTTPTSLALAINCPVAAWLCSSTTAHTWRCRPTGSKSVTGHLGSLASLRASMQGAL